MVLKLYMEQEGSLLSLRVYFIDTRFRYSSDVGVMRQFEAFNGWTIVGGTYTGIDLEEKELMLGSSDIDLKVFDVGNENITAELDMALTDWARNCVHLKDIVSNHLGNIYEY